MKKKKLREKSIHSAAEQVVNFTILSFYYCSCTEKRREELNNKWRRRKKRSLLFSARQFSADRGWIETCLRRFGEFELRKKVLRGWKKFNELFTCTLRVKSGKRLQNWVDQVQKNNCKKIMHKWSSKNQTLRKTTRICSEEIMNYKITSHYHLLCGCNWNYIIQFECNNLVFFKFPELTSLFSFSTCCKFMPKLLVLLIRCTNQSTVLICYSICWRKKCGANCGNRKDRSELWGGVSRGDHAIQSVSFCERKKIEK